MELVIGLCCGDKVGLISMGIKSSTVSHLEFAPPSPKPKSSPPTSTSCWHKMRPPSYNHHWTDLHYAASHGNLRRIQEITHKSGTVNLNKKDYYGKSALYWASYKGHQNCVAELLNFGADVNASCRHGGTPLHAVVSLYPECALLLIRYGADVNQADNWGVTPMYLAATNAQLDVIKYLVEAGAKFSYKNKKTGDIPKQLAKHTDFLEYLQNKERTPPSLQQLSRLRVRHLMGAQPLRKIRSLPLPMRMKDYLRFKDIG